VQPGQTLDGKYRILRKLGEGGMGQVFLVEHMHLHRQEALKILHPFLARERHFVSRFRREARAINRLQHPNIVSVFDFGELPDGRFYLAMEYADGPSLASPLASAGRLSVARTLHLLIQLASAIDHAHGRGVIHRDLKPDNLVVVDRGSKRDVLKVLDFGIAKIVADDYRESLIATPVGDIFGTLAYLAPEVLSGQPSGAAADLYAFGCIAFELMTGRPPFEGSKMDTVQAHLTRPPPSVSTRNADVPPKLAEIIELCLKKDPAERAPNAAHILTLLAQVTLSPPRREAGSSDWEPIDTVERRPSETADAHAMTEAVDAESLEDPAVRYRRLVTALVGQIIDAGQADISLVAGLARLRELEDELSQNLAEGARIERALEELDDAARAREGKLRFALGELQFEQMRAPQAGKHIGDQVARLEERLASIAAATEREREQLLEKAIALAARRSDLEAELDDDCRDIEANASRAANAPEGTVTEIRGLREVIDRRATVKMR
jgi:hypothetical protein